MSVTTAKEFNTIYDEALATALQDQDAGFNIDKIFGYLNPLDATKSPYQFGDISDAPVVATDPSQYTEDEKNIIVKRNIGRIAQLFEQYDYLDMWAHYFKDVQRKYKSYRTLEIINNVFSFSYHDT